MGTAVDTTNSNGTQLTAEQQEAVHCKRFVLGLSNSIKTALPKHLTPERMLRVAWTAISRNQKLMTCTQESLAAAIIQASQLGLEPDGVLGQAYLIPRWNGKTKKNEANFQVGYKGLLTLARRSGEIKSVEARCVHAKDVFNYSFGLEPMMQHIPSSDTDPGPVRFVYAVVKLKDGGFQWDVWSTEKVDAHKARFSEAWKNDKTRPYCPWTTSWESMAKKTVLISALKFAPLSVELQQVVEQETSAPPVNIGDLTPDTPSISVDSLRPRQISAGEIITKAAADSLRRDCIHFGIEVPPDLDAFTPDQAVALQRQINELSEGEPAPEDK